MEKAMSTIRRLIVALSVILLGTGCVPGATQSPVPKTETAFPATSTPPLENQSTTPTEVIPYNPYPYELVSLESLLAYLEDLTSIQPYSGWRNSASSGEAQAFDYVAGKLAGFSNLQDRGLELERQEVEVYLSTEIWQTRLTLTVNHQKIDVPANGLRGSRRDRYLAAYFDSDGVLGDSEPDPWTASGSPLMALDEEALYTLAAGKFTGRILFLDYALIDSATNSAASSNADQLRSMMDDGLAGVVLVTQYSNKGGESRGTLIGDGAVFLGSVPSRRVPILYVRIEDLNPAGMATWEDLQQIDAAELMLDADLFCPGMAGNLIAHIPGADPSKAIILGAHIDSPNGPGAFDDGSGSAALLEVARVLNVAQIQPPVDVYLAWFGGHEIGTYGSAYFTSTHQELLDRTLAEVQMDGLGHPLEGKASRITMMSTNYARFGDESQPLPDFLSKAAAARGLSLDRLVEYGLIADNSNFDAFNVPNVYLGYLNARDWSMKGSEYFHYANHWHDPYETVDLVRTVGDTFVEMTKVMLSAALEIGRLRPDLRVTPAIQRRALIVASHTESVSMTTAMQRDLGMALAWEGFDVDLIPYRQAISPSDLGNAGIVILAPTLDYPGNSEKWSENELAVLRDYVGGGGLLVVTNSAYNHATVWPLDKSNEDSRALDGFLEPMGIRFKTVSGSYDGSDTALAVSEHPLTDNAAYLSYYQYNGVSFSMKAGSELYRASGIPIVGLVDYGEQGGQVLVVADVGMLQLDKNGAKNLEFLKNIARFATTR
jgi:hypothetical protein